MEPYFEIQISPKLLIQFLILKFSQILNFFANFLYQICFEYKIFQFFLVLDLSISNSKVQNSILSVCLQKPWAPIEIVKDNSFKMGGKGEILLEHPRVNFIIKFWCLNANFLFISINNLINIILVFKHLMFSHIA